MAEFSKLNGYDIKDKKAVRYYDTVALMKVDESIKEGQYVKTKGYYEIGDGGEAEYLITDTQSLTEHQELLVNGLYANLIINDFINIKQIGINPNNTSSENTTILNNIIYNYDNILFKDINITINDGLNIQSNQKITLENANIFSETSTNRKYIFNIDNKENVYIKGFNSSLSFNKPSTDQQACLKIINSKNIFFEGIDLIKAGGDGITVSGTDNETISENINISNLTIDNNRRNGISLIGGIKGFTIKNCKITNTSGTNPQYGIDLETWQDGIYNENILIEKCIFEGNTYGGIDIFPYTKDVKIINNKFISNGINSVMTVAKGEESYPKNIVIQNNDFTGNGLYLRGTQYAEYIIENNSFNSCNITTDAESDFVGYYTTNPKNGYITIKNNTIKNSNAHGISIGGSSNVLITGNVIEKPKNRFITSTLSNNINIINNTLIDHAQNPTTPTGIEGIYLLTTHNIKIDGNVFIDNTQNTYTSLIRLNASCQKLILVNNNALNTLYTNFLTKDGTINNEVNANNLTNS